MRKRGQITLFIMVGMLILIIVSVSLFLVSDSTGDPTNVIKSTIDSTSIKNFMDLCVGQVTLEGLVFISQRGGYYEIPPQLIKDDTSLWYEGHNIQPFLFEFKSSLSQYVRENLDACINDMEYFKQQGYDIENPENDRIKVNVIFGESEVYGKVTYPGKIKKGTYIHNLKDFSFRHDVRLKELYELSTAFINQISRTTFDRCNPLACLADIPDDVTISYTIEGEDIMFDSEVDIVSNDVTIKEFNLRFAAKVDMEDAFVSEEFSRFAVIADSPEDSGGISNKHALEVLDEANVNYDYYDISTISDMVPRLSYYDVILITGNFLGRYRAIDFVDFGDTSYYYFFVEPSIKSWVRDGGALWINDPGENMRYYINDGPFITIHETTTGCVAGCTVHPLTQCPNDISDMLDAIQYSGSTSLSISDYPTEVVVGTKDKAAIWIEYVGSGVVLYDHASMTISDGIRHEDRDDLYFMNVLNYLNAASNRIRGSIHDEITYS